MVRAQDPPLGAFYLSLVDTDWIVELLVLLGHKQGGKLNSWPDMQSEFSKL
jgi:hypothetical protein